MGDEPKPKPGKRKRGPGAGRPRRFTAQLKKDFVEAIGLGLSFGEALGALGIDRKILRDERKRDRKFHRDIKGALPSQELALLRKLANAKEPKAAAQLLRFLRPDRYAPKKPEPQSTITNNTQVNIGVMSEEKRREHIAAIMREAMRLNDEHGSAGIETEQPDGSAAPGTLAAGEGSQERS